MDRAPGRYSHFVTGDLRTLAALSDFVSRFRRTSVDGDRVYVFGGSDAGPGYNDMLHCLDRASGECLWSFGGREHDFDLLSALAFDGSVVLVGRNDGRVHALDRDSGQVRWSMPVGAEMAIPAVAHGRVFTAGSDGRLCERIASQGSASEVRRFAPGPCFARETKAGLVVIHQGGISSLHGPPWRTTWEWTTGFPYLLDRGPDSEAALIVNWRDEYARLNPSTGKTIWQVVVEIGAGTPVPVAADDRRVWLATPAGRLVGLDIDTGGHAFERKLAGISSIASQGRQIYVDAGHGVLILEDGLGASVGEFPVEGDVTGALAATADQLFVQRGEVPRRLLHSIPLRPGAPQWCAEVGSWGLS